MDAELFSRASSAYERGRVRWAALSALPLAIVPIASFFVGHRLGSSVGLGVALLVGATVMLWRGQSYARGLTLGLKAGFIPLVLSHGANLYGHLCTASGCTSLCVPACIAGGLVAGLWIALSAARAPWQVLASAASVALLVGSFGCACIGFGGLAGMTLGLAASMSVTRAFAR